MAMTRRVGAAFGFEGSCSPRYHIEVHGAQHVGQHVVGLDLQVVGLSSIGTWRLPRW
jgi:hypothetical protein